MSCVFVGRLSDFFIQRRTFCSTGSLSCSSTNVVTSKAADLQSHPIFVSIPLYLVLGVILSRCWILELVFVTGFFGLIRLQVRNRVRVFLIEI